MKTVELEALRLDPDRLAQEIESGEDFVVVDQSRPVAEVHPVPATPEGRRPYGLYAGQFVVPDDFNAPLPDDILRDFHAL